MPSFERVAVEHSLSHIGRWQTKLVTLALARTYLTFAVTAVVRQIFNVLPKMFNTAEVCYNPNLALSLWQ